MTIASIAKSGGGVPEALRSLSRALQNRPGTTVEVFSMSASSEDGEAEWRDEDWGGARLHYHAVRGPASFSYAPTLQRTLAERPLDLVHLHGLWMYPSVATRRWGVQSGKPCLISPHGMLD